LSKTAAADNGAVFTAVTQNSFGTTTSNPARLTITTDRLPQITITAQNEGYGYATGDTLTYSATATDAEDGTLPASAFTWEANFHHDTHSHPFFPPTSGSKSGSVTVPEFEKDNANTWIALTLSVKDSAGQVGTATKNIYPRHQLSSLRTAVAPTNGVGAIELDRNNGGSGAKDGGPIVVDSIPYPKGLGVHAPSEVQYKLGGICAGKLIADVGIDDSVGMGGSVVFQVFADGEKLYDSGVVRGSDPRADAHHVKVDLTGKQELRLVVTDAGDGNNLDRANWGGARLTCDKLPESTLAPAASGGGAIASPGGGGGCTTGGSGRFDPTLGGLVLSALAALLWRRRKTSSESGQ
jgi:LPXTG-motif cell wall-anchored protein